MKIMRYSELMLAIFVLYIGIGSFVSCSAEARYEKDTCGFEVAEPLQPKNTAFEKISGLAINSMDHLYVVDRNAGTVYDYDIEADTWNNWQQIGQDLWAAVFDAINNYIYVSDYGRSCIRVIHPKRGYIKNLGEPGNQPGEFWNPAGMMVTQDGRLFVADQNNDRIQMYDLTTHTWDILEIKESLEAPVDMAMNAEGDLFIAEYTGNRIIHIDVDDMCENIIVPPESIGPLHHPISVACDTLDNLYIADYENNRILIYDPYVDSWCSIAPKPDIHKGFINPTAIAISPNNTLYISDCAHTFIQKWKPESGIESPRQTNFSVQADN